jgi:hypothetical protein
MHQAVQQAGAPETARAPAQGDEDAKRQAEQPSPRPRRAAIAPPRAIRSGLSQSVSIAASEVIASKKALSAASAAPVSSAPG